MVTGEILDLSGLSVDDIGCVLKVVVDELLVSRVDEWAKIEHRDGDEGQAPDRSELDQPIGDEGGNECRNGVSRLLGEENTLEFDNEEVDELFHVFQGCFESLSGNCIILLGSERGGQTLG